RSAASPRRPCCGAWSRPGSTAASPGRASTTTRRIRPGRSRACAEHGGDTVSEPAFQNLIVTVSDRVAVVTVNRPDKRNALNGRTMDELRQVFARLRDDASVGGVILTGAGD